MNAEVTVHQHMSMNLEHFANPEGQTGDEVRPWVRSYYVASKMTSAALCSEY